MMNVGSNGRRQMFYITFLLHYFGLSREGINILSKYGYSVTLDMFDYLRRSYRAGSTEMTRLSPADLCTVACLQHYTSVSYPLSPLCPCTAYTPNLLILCEIYLRQIQVSTHVLWVDNFSKFVARSIPSLAASTYSSCLWTGVAAFKCSGSLDRGVMYSNSGAIIPAMPDDPFVYADAVKQGVSYIINSCRSYYDRSLVAQFDIRNVPPKIDTKAFPYMKEEVDRPENTTRCVHPCKLMDYNIGSNQGLLAVVRSLYEENNMHTEQCNHYLLLNVDENIFWRILKVLFLLIFYIDLAPFQKPLNK